MTRSARRPLIWVLATMVGVATALYATRERVLTSIGHQLVRADPLVRSDAIVILAGGTPQREIEAADLYRAQWAPLVLMTLEPETEAAQVLRQRGVAFETQLELRRRILRSLGVPDAAVILLDRERATSTRMETDLVRGWIVQNHARRIILVTSPFHTARASLVFRRTLDSLGTEVLARPASHEAFDPERWWRERVQLRNGIFEWQKLLFYYVAYR